MADFLKRLVRFTVPLSAFGLMPAHATPQADFPHTPIALPDGDGEAEFHLFDGFAVISVRRPDGQVEPLKVVSDVNDALAVLADQRLSFAWPALLAWAGDDLIGLRDRALARNKLAAEIGLPGAPAKASSEAFSGDAGVTVTLQYVRALHDAGRTDEALALLRRQLAGLKGEQGKHAREFLTMRLATMTFDEGDPAGAIALLEAESADRTRSAIERGNLDINLAALLVRSGSYQRGLVLINQVWAQFSEQTEEDDTNFKVPESDAQFAWIKACALDGLGSHGKARALINSIADGTAPGAMDRITAGSDPRVTYFLCTRDSSGLAREFAKLLAQAPPAGTVFLAVQPSSWEYAPDRATFALALKQPALTDALKGRVRMLEPQFTPALVSWRTRPSGSTSKP